MSQTRIRDAGIELSLRATLDQRRGTAGHLLNPSDMMRFSATIRAIPGDTESVLDVGCGLGVLTDCLAALGYRATGVDIDQDAMQHMTSPSDVGSISALPYPSMTFDTVIANEILEHLPVAHYEGARRELARVASRSIVVTVPNGEPLDAATTRCPRCTCIYSLHGHVRRFDRTDLADLIPGFGLAGVSTAGPYKVRHRSIEWYAKRRGMGRWPSRAGVTCPQCGFVQPGSSETTEFGASGSTGGKVARTILGFPWSRWWFVSVYRRVELGKE